MLPPLVSQGDVVFSCKPELSGWRPLARVRGHGLVVKAIYTWSGPCNSEARYKQTKVLALFAENKFVNSLSTYVNKVEHKGVWETGGEEVKGQSNKV